LTTSWAALAFAQRFQDHKRVHNAEETMTEIAGKQLGGVWSAPGTSLR